MPTNSPWLWRRWPEPTEEMRTAQYRFLELWQQTYQGELLILLPDTFGTSNSFAMRPTGWPTGPGSASTARTPL